MIPWPSNLHEGRQRVKRNHNLRRNLKHNIRRNTRRNLKHNLKHNRAQLRLRPAAKSKLF